MALNLGPSSTFNCSHIKTAAGTVVITKNGTLVASKGLQTAAGTTILSAVGALAPGQVSGYKVCLPFETPVLTTNLTTYCFIPAGSVYYGAMATGTGRYAHVPWTGSVLAIGARAALPRTAGNCTFTVMNGATATAVVATLNSTNTKRVDSAVAAVDANAFTANNIRVRVKTSASFAPVTNQAIVGLVWLEV